MKRSYNILASIYDTLSRVVYGNTLVEAQVFLLPEIPPNATVLIIGGGTGWVLEEITQIHPSGLSITYLDIAEQMIALARQRNAGQNTVRFINSPVENGLPPGTFNIILTPFIFDNFSQPTFEKVFNLLEQHLEPNGTWLCVDFQEQENAHWYQRALLKVMYTFFRALCNIEAKQLPDIEGRFKNKGYKAIQQKNFANGMIASTAYKKE